MDESWRHLSEAREEVDVNHLGYIEDHDPGDESDDVRDIPGRTVWTRDDGSPAMVLSCGSCDIAERFIGPGQRCLRHGGITPPLTEAGLAEMRRLADMFRGA